LVRIRQEAQKKQGTSIIEVPFFIAYLCSFALTQKNQKVKAARILLKLCCIPLKVLKLASLKQSPLLNAPFHIISSRKIHEAGPVGVPAFVAFGSR
jgi:hypothetical protein